MCESAINNKCWVLKQQDFCLKSNPIAYSIMFYADLPRWHTLQANQHQSNFTYCQSKLYKIPSQQELHLNANQALMSKSNFDQFGKNHFIFIYFSKNIN